MDGWRSTLVSFKMHFFFTWQPEQLESMDSITSAVSPDVTACQTPMAFIKRQNFGLLQTVALIVLVLKLLVNRLNRL